MRFISGSLPALRAPLTGPDGLSWFPPLTLLLFLGPVAAGLAGMLLPAFGYFPVLGGEGFSLEPWRRLLDWPGLWSATRLSLVTGLLASAASFGAVCLLLACCGESAPLRWMRRLLGPLLAIPHAAVALGFLFLFSPSGWMVRLLSLGGLLPVVDAGFAPDTAGFSVIAVLFIKETVYLFLMLLNALQQVPASRTLATARALGRGPLSAWFLTVLPLVYGRIRPPLFAVLAFSLSVVDVPLVLAPANYPTLSVLVLRWFNDPDLSRQFLAAAGACLLLVLVLGVFAVWALAEWLARRFGLFWVRGGAPRARGQGTVLRAVASLPALLAALFGLACILIAAIWSFTWRWRYPDMLPSEWTAGNWDRYGDLLRGPALTTALTGICAVLVALLLVVGCLEAERRGGGRQRLWLLYIPLLVPQPAFLFGAQALLALAGWGGMPLTLVWAHLLFVLPYVYLSLAGPWRDLDPRYERTACSLGAGRGRVLLRVRLPMLLQATAVGFAVSAGQYLPTVFAGGGRFATLTTEAVSLVSGGDRRLSGLFALLQSALPLAGFLLAWLLPAWLFRRRAGMRGLA